MHREYLVFNFKNQEQHYVLTYHVERGENPPNLFSRITIEDCFEYEIAAAKFVADSDSKVKLNSAPCSTNLENPPPAENDYYDDQKCLLFYAYPVNASRKK